MNRLPSITKSNMPKEPTVFDMANKRAESRLTGLDEALNIVAQTRNYDGGQIDMFPKELIKISSLFIPKASG